MITLPLFMVPMTLLSAVMDAEGEAMNTTREILNVQYYPKDSMAKNLCDLSEELDKCGVPWHALTYSWEQFPYRPEVRFRIAYSHKELLLQYHVREKYVRAQCALEDQSCMPANDSCVEFFVSPGGDDHYLNFEFSCIGYCLIESGKKGSKRLRLPLSETARVRRYSSLGNQPFEHMEGNFEWTLAAAIPLEMISAENASSLAGKTWRANFYKCGDELKEKTYLAWSPVHVPAPAFHHPAEFGTIAFLPHVP